MKTACFLLSVGGVAAVEVGMAHAPLPPLPAVGLARCLEIGILLGIFSLSTSGVQTIGMSFGQLGRGVKRGLIWSAAFGVAAAAGGVALFLGGVHPLTLIHVGLPDTPSQIALFFLVGGVIAPVAEELFFRGVIYGFLRQTLFKPLGVWGLGPSLIISTALFVLAHRSPAGLPLPQMVGGVVFCLAYELGKNLFTPILIHGLGNLALFTLSWLGTRI